MAINVADLDETPDTTNYASFSDATLGDIGKTTGTDSTGREYGALKTTFGAAALGIPDVVDTVVSSLTSAPRGAVNQRVLNAIGSPGFTEFAGNIHGATEVASGVYGIIGSELLTRGAIKLAKPMIATLRTAPYARRFLQLEDQLEAARTSVRAFDTELAKRGLTGAREFTGSLTVPVVEWSPSGMTMVDKLVSRNQVVNSVRRLGQATTAGRTALTEGVMAALLNTNSFLYSDDVASNIFYSAVGIGAGGYLGGIMEGYSIRKWAKSDELNRLRAGALDPIGLEQASNRSFKALDETYGPSLYNGDLGGVQTDKATSYLIQAQANVDPKVDKTAANSMRTARLGMAWTELEKVTQKGLGFQGTGFIIGKDTSATAEGRALKAYAYADPGNLLGVEQIGARPYGYTAQGAIAERSRRLDSEIIKLNEILDDEAKLAKGQGKPKQKPRTPEEMEKVQRRLRKNLFAKYQTTPSVIIDGERLPIHYADQFDDWREPTIKAVRDKDSKAAFEAFDEDGKTFGLALDEGLNLIVGGGKKFESLDQFDVNRLGRLGLEAKKSIVTRMQKDSNFMLALPGKPNWFQLDLAEEIATELEKIGGIPNIHWGKGLSREQAQLESLAQKMEFAIKHKKAFDSPEQMAKLRARLNMPRLSAYEMGVSGAETHPLDGVFRGMINQDTSLKSIREILNEMGSAGVIQAMNDYKKLNGLTVATRDSIKDLKGNLFSFQLDESGKPVPMLIAYTRALKPFEWTTDNLIERLAIGKHQVFKTLSAPTAGQFSNGLAAEIYQHPALGTAASVGELSDTQMAPNLIPFTANSAPSSGVGAVINTLTSAEQRGRDAPTLLAATQLRETVDRYTRAYAKQRFNETGVSELKNMVYGPRNTRSAMLVDQFYSPGVVAGWDLEAKLTREVGPDKTPLFGFTLKDTQHNRARFKNQFGREMEKAQKLLGPKGQPVVLDDLSRQFVEAMKPIFEEQRIADNAINRSIGSPEIARQDWYVPPPNITDKYVAYTVGPTGQPVPGGTLIANTQAELERLKQAALDDPASIANRPGHLIRNRKEIADFATIMDRRAMVMVDANDAVTRGGQTNKGSLAGPQMVSGSGIKMLETVQKKYIDHGGDMLEVILQDQIKGARARAQLSKGELVAKPSEFKDKSYRSAHDYWLQEIQGTSSLAAGGSIVAPVVNTVEGVINRVLAETAPSLNKVYHAATDWITKRIPWANDVADRETFSKLSEQVGRFMPFDKVDEFIANRTNKGVPTAKGITASMNRFTAAWMLRMLELGHPIMNLGGILNAMPAVVSSFRKLEGENLDDFAKRVGHSASIFQTGEQDAVSILSMPKLAYQGFKQRWSDDAAYIAFRDHTERLGMRGQEVAELDRQMAAIRDKSTVEAFFMGDDTRQGFSKKGLVGHLSTVTDKSEDFARSWALDIGYVLGKQLGITHVDDLANFSHDVANKMIANYNPTNRAEIFQGALGSVVGLFQSYMINYYQRMFRYLETGDLRSAAVQMAMQGMLFGGKTVPGFQQMNDLVFNHTDGETSPYDAMVQRFGPRGGDLLMMGSMSNLPRLFGAPAVDFASRGDVSPRLPGSDGYLPPAVSAITKVMDGVGEAIQLFTAEQGIASGQRLAEIVSNALPNRPLAGMVEVFLGDEKDTDKYGQLVSESNSLMESTYRILGLRSARQSNDLNAYYMNKQMQEIEASRAAILRTSSRALIRSGREDQLPVLFESYIKNGGDPRHFNKWYRDNWEAANTTRSERALETTMRDPDKMAQTNRFLAAEVGAEQDEQTEPVDDAYPVEAPIEDLNPEFVPLSE